MSIGICRVQKIPAPKDIAGIQLHNRRERDHSNTNPDIDRTRSTENYSISVAAGKSGGFLVTTHIGIQKPDKSYNALIDERIRNGYTGKKAVRKDAVRCCEVLFTASGDFFDKHPDQAVDFFKACVMFAAERFGARNIIAATVHMDEETPHMHLDFVPLTIDGRLSAKSVLGGRKEMQKLQDDFYEKVGKRFGLERGTRADLDDPDADRPRKHLTVQELKAETAAQLAANENKLTALGEQLQAVEAQLEEAENANKRAIVEAAEAENNALLAEERAQQADKRMETAEIRLQNAESKLTEVNEQYEVAAQGLKSILDKKARASEIHKISDLFGETVEYHKNMLESTRAIGAEAYKEMMKANKTMQEAVSVQQRAEKKEQSIESMYQSAKAAKAQAEQELKRQQQLRQSMEQEIERRATELVNKRIQAMFGDVPSSREKRLEQFCARLSLKDGQSALDFFNEQERQLQAKTRGHGFHR